MKIKNKLNNKPKLKKALKIIGISITMIFAAFGVICSGILIGSCANQNTKEVVATTPIYHNKPKQDVIVVNQYDLYSITDIMNGQAYDNYLDWARQALNLDPLDSSYYSHVFNNVGGAIYFISTRDVTFSNFTADSTRYLTCQQVKLIIHQRETYSNGNYSVLFRLQFISTTTSSTFIDIPFTLLYSQTMNGRYAWYTNGVRYTTNNGTSFSPISSYLTMICEYQDSAISSWCRDFFPYGQYNSQSYYTNGYETGRDVGESIGYTNGYTTGYNTGYSDGVSSTQGVSNNPFQLLKNAFESIAGILNIDVLPNLKLGVLIFAPLIVTILIVIIKMIKG